MNQMYAVMERLLCLLDASTDMTDLQFFTKYVMIAHKNDISILNVFKILAFFQFIHIQHTGMKTNALFICAFLKR